jgi:hypothetical protein
MEGGRKNWKEGWSEGGRGALPVSFLKACVDLIL